MKNMTKSGRVEFKTDNTELFNFSLEQVKEAGWALIAYTYDLHHQEEMNEGNIMTEYEQKFSEKGVKKRRQGIISAGLWHSDRSAQYAVDL